MDPSELEKQIGDLELAVDRLRSLYDQYFMGIEKIEPGVTRKDVDRRIHALRKEPIRNTALRFRFQMILQRYNVFQTHWQRICREIDNGTYKRHLLRAEQRVAELAAPQRRTTSRPAPSVPRRAEPPPRDLAAELAELDKEFAPPSPRSIAPRPPPLSKRAPDRLASTGAEEGLPEYRIRQLYVEYVEAKRRQRESTAAVTYDALADSLRESSNRLRQKHGKPVDFEVGIKDGKAILKPVIRR